MRTFTPKPVVFEDKFIAFLDVLGFKQLVSKAELTGDPLLAQVIGVLEEAELSHHRTRLERDGPHICPHSSYIQKHLSFQATQASDSLIVSCEISPAGAIHLLHHCWVVVMSLLVNGVMCRGYIGRGSICHDGRRFTGTGYQSVYLNSETAVSVFKRSVEERGTPFVEIDKAVTEYVTSHDDGCTGELFRRFTKTDGELTALFPFQSMSNSYTVMSAFEAVDHAKNRASNERLRRSLKETKNRVMALVDKNNASAVQKSEHYVAALDSQIAICDRFDDMLARLMQPFPGYPTGKR